MSNLVAAAAAGGGQLDSTTTLTVDNSASRRAKLRDERDSRTGRTRALAFLGQQTSDSEQIRPTNNNNSNHHRQHHNSHHNHHRHRNHHYNYHLQANSAKRLLTILLISLVYLLSANAAEAKSSQLQSQAQPQLSMTVQRRYLPLEAEQRPFRDTSDHQQQQQQHQSAPGKSEFDQQQQQQQHAALVSFAADMLQQQQQHQQQQQSGQLEQRQRSLWTHEDSSLLQSRPGEQNIGNQQQQQFVSYRPLASTLPSISRQLAPPPNSSPFYELSLAPANTIQLDSSFQSGADESAQFMAGAMSQPSPVRMEPPSPPPPSPPSQATAANATARSAELQQQQQQQQRESDSSQSNQGDSRNSQPSAASGEQQQQQQVDRIEPRQRRRLFNRILKKAEWNHLFLELSKVFLKYFLDLALKDLIGKQSGSTTGSGGGGDSTTSRKKLDAQSELADLFREFVKNAISNI